MKNKILKISIICILFTVFIAFCTQNVLAWDPNWDILEDSRYSGNASNAVTNIMGSAISVLSVVGAGVAIIMLIVVGLKYITESPEGKAEVKKTLPNYVTGAVILFAASGLLKILQMFINANVNSI